MQQEGDSLECFGGGGSLQTRLVQSCVRMGCMQGGTRVSMMVRLSWFTTSALHRELFWESSRSFLWIVPQVKQFETGALQRFVLHLLDHVYLQTCGGPKSQKCDIHLTFHTWPTIQCKTHSCKTNQKQPIIFLETSLMGGNIQQPTIWCLKVPLNLHNLKSLQLIFMKALALWKLHKPIK